MRKGRRAFRKSRGRRRGKRLRNYRATRGGIRL